MSLFQTLCLLLFNEGDGFNLDYIKQATGIGKDFIQHHSLKCLLVQLNHGIAKSEGSF